MSDTALRIACSCGCAHVFGGEIVDGVLRIEKENCQCPSWVLHTITTPEKVGVSCCGTLRDGHACPFPPVTERTMCDLHLAAWKWRADPERFREYIGHEQPATQKQTDYISALAKANPELAAELERAVNAFGKESSYNALTACTKGQAMFVIKCFNGEIRPRRMQP